MSAATIERTYSTHELAREVGLSHVALHRWSEAEPETLGPAQRSHGSGTQRRWSEADAERIRKAQCFRRGVGVLVERRTGAGPTVEATARFVREAVLVEGRGWVWSTGCFTLIVPVDVEGCA